VSLLKAIYIWHAVFVLQAVEKKRGALLKGGYIRIELKVIIVIVIVLVKVIGNSKSIYSATLQTTHVETMNVGTPSQFC
jgi:hypothetical protein